MLQILNFPTFPSFCKWFFLGNFIFYQISVAFLQWPWRCRPGDEASKPSPGRPRCRRRFGARDRRDRRERRERTERRERRERRERKRKRKRAIRVLRGRASNWWSKFYIVLLYIYISYLSYIYTSIYIYYIICVYIGYITIQIGLLLFF